MKVPFLDLKVQYEAIKDEVGIAINSVLDKTAFAGGPFVKEFEENYAAYCNTTHAIGVGSGTDALWAALVGLGVGPGDEVITVPNTFIATVEAISYCGAKPVFVDIEKSTCTMDPNLIERAITPSTKAILPVHLFGQMADMNPIMEIAKKHGLAVIEDACQAHGAEYKGKKAGSIGDAGCFSFYPGKNLGAYGEAGAVVTSNEALAQKMSMFRDHGQSKKYHHAMVGWNARMDGFQGAILNVKLKYLDSWTDARRANARIYYGLLADATGLTVLQEAEYAKHVYHLYPILIDKRDKLMAYLGEKEIASGIHYPVALHLTEAYQDLGYSKGNFPVAEQVADQLVSLPMFPELRKEQIEYVVQEVKAFPGT